MTSSSSSVLPFFFDRILLAAACVQLYTTQHSLFSLLFFRRLLLLCFLPFRFPIRLLLPDSLGPLESRLGKCLSLLFPYSARVGLRNPIRFHRPSTLGYEIPVSIN